MGPGSRERLRPMDHRILKDKFAAIGARLRIVSAVAGPFRTPPRYAMDVIEARRGDSFELRLGRDPDVELRVIDLRPRERHLLLLDDEDRRLLCGHDERHWFVAGVADGANVAQAKESLKPRGVRAAEGRTRVRRRNRNRRRNAAWIRQGEWFFLPVPDLTVDPWLILRKEPLSRGAGSKPHVVDEAYRLGGTRVYVSSAYPAGITEPRYRKLILENPGMKRIPWDVRVRDPEVYVRGRVRHPDHQTVRLDGWHRVHMNAEPLSPNVAFLD